MDENRTIIAVVAAVLVVFSLTVSMVVPRRNPDFPGKRLGLFFGVCTLLVVAMLVSVELFGTEDEAAAHESQPAEAGGEAAPPETGGAAETGAPAETEALEGDAVAGEAVFTSAGCGSCHTLAAAGSTGAIGPSLDDVQPSFATVVDVVTNGAPPMPAFGNDGTLTNEQIQDVAAYVVQSTAG